MYEWEIVLTWGVHYLTADDYTVAKGKYIFWASNKAVRTFLEEEVVQVNKLGLTLVR